jgi:ferrous iron transport protein B
VSAEPEGARGRGSDGGSLLEAPRRVVLVGRESVGKSELAAALSGAPSRSANYRGSTLAPESYAAGGLEVVDTPGLYRLSDREALGALLASRGQEDCTAVVVQATRLDEDLELLLPLAGGAPGVVVVTFADRMGDVVAAGVPALRRRLGVPVVALDARRRAGRELELLRQALEEPGPLPAAAPAEGMGWREAPRRTVLEHPVAGPLAGAALLLAPPLLAVWFALWSAAVTEPLVNRLLQPLTEPASRLPGAAATILAGDFGVLTMLPLLFVWAVPTVVMFSVLLGAYKASGLLDRVSSAVHPLLRPFGLAGRDLVRVVMGLGCNVPAVIATRSCSSCSRPAAVGAIAFGAACSYQLGATTAVLAAAGRPLLVLPFLLYLAVTTLLYTRLTAPRPARSALNVLMVEGCTYLVPPRPAAVWREARGTLASFFQQAVPVFLLISVAAATLDASGVLHAVTAALTPLLAMFNLPAESAAAITFAAVRKDGLLLLLQGEVATALTSAQLLTALYLGGTLLPCLVTALTVAREMSPGFAGRLLLRQATAASLFALVIAWGWP